MPEHLSLHERTHADTCPFCHDTIEPGQESWPCDRFRVPSEAPRLGSSRRRFPWWQGPIALFVIMGGPFVGFGLGQALSGWGELNPALALAGLGALVSFVWVLVIALFGRRE